MSDGEALLSIKADVRDATAGVKKLQSQNEKLATSVDKLNKRNSKLSERLDHVKNKTDGASRGMVDYAAKLYLATAGLRAAVAQADQWAQRAIKVQAATKALSFSITEARKSTQGLVGDFELMIAANKASTLGVADNSVAFAKLADQAVRLGATMGVDATQAVNDLVEGLGKGSPEVLNNLGLIVKADEAYRAYAESIGVTVNELDDQQKTEARMQEGLRQLEEKTEDLAKANEGLAQHFQQVKVAATNLIDQLLNMEDTLGDLAGENAKAAFAGFTDLMRTNLAAITLGASEATTAILGLDSAINQMTAVQQVNAVLKAREQSQVAAANTVGSKRQAEEFRRQMEARELERYDGFTEAEAMANARELRYIEYLADQEDKNKKHGKRIQAAANRDNNMQFDISREAQNNATIAQREREIEQRETEYAQVELGLMQMERESELKLAAATTDAEQFDAEVYRFEQEVEMAEIRATVAEERMLAAETEQEQLAAYEDLAQQRHEAELARIEQEMFAEEYAAQQRERQLKRRMKIADATVDITKTTVATMGQIWAEQAENNGKSGQALFAIEKGIKVSLLALDAITYGSRSVASFIAQDYFSGAKFAAAAVAATASAVSTATLDMDSAKSKAGAGGGGGGRGSGVTIQRDEPVDSDIPASRGGSPVQPGGSSRPNAGRSNTTNIGNVTLIGQPDDDTVDSFIRAIDKRRADGQGINA